MKNNGSKSIGAKPLLPKCPTGIQGLDEITGGGFGHDLRRQGHGDAAD